MVNIFAVEDLLIPVEFAKEADISSNHVIVELEQTEPMFVVAVEGFHQLHCLVSGCDHLRAYIFGHVRALILQ